MTVLLPGAAQARIAAAITTRLPDVAQVRRFTQTTTASGGQRQTWVNHGVAVPALITPWIGRSGGQEGVVHDRMEVTTMWKITLPAVTDVGPADRITSAGRTFEIKALAAPESLEVLRECICIERIGEPSA